MMAKWTRIEGRRNEARTEAMLVPGGMVLRTTFPATSGTTSSAVAMVFVPGPSNWTGNLEGWIKDKEASD